MRSFKTFTPSSGQPSGEFTYQSFSEISPRLDASLSAFQDWRREPFSNRTAVLIRMADLLESRKEDLARRMANEMGKPVTAGIAESEKCAWVCRYYAEHGERFLQPETLPSDAKEARVVFQPLGPVLAIMPWNFPLWQVLRFAAPALVAGNTALLKHADITTGCALEIETMLAEAGLPENVFQTLVIDHDTTEQVIRHPAVQAVTLTGSTRAGRAVAAIAGSELKKTVLELGGSDPYVILEDADPEKAADICVSSRMINNGQTCISAKRWITTPGIHDTFMEAALDKMKSYTPADPLLPDTRLGPLARADLRDTLHQQIHKSVAAGAQLLCGGNMPGGEGFYYPATLLTDVAPGQPAADEELFGPAGAIMAARNETHALALANQTVYGLGAAVITADIDRGRHLASHELEAGCCFVNDFVKSDPRLPFGGMKQSGYGRELSLWGIREFVNLKTVVVAG